MFAIIEHKPNEVLRLFAKGTTEHCAIWSPVRMQDVASLSNVVTVIIGVLNHSVLVWFGSPISISPC